MANWRDLRNNFKVDQLKGLNVRFLKDVQPYYSPLRNGAKWAGWTIRKGQLSSKLYSWVDSTPANQNYPALDVDGLWLMFYLNDDYNQRPYYVKLESKMIDWDDLKSRLDAQRRLNMNFYENMFEDFDTAISDYSNEVKDYVTNALYVGGAFVLLMLYWNTVGKYQTQAQIFKGVLKTTVKELRT